MRKNQTSSRFPRIGGFLNPVSGCILVVALVACGGGGSGGGGNAGANDRGGSASPLPEALTFLEPSELANDGEYTTDWGYVNFSGSFHSRFVPALDCSDSSNFSARSFLEVRWQNLANGSHGEANSGIACVNLPFGLVGVDAHWFTYFIPLERGENVFRFEVLDGGTVIARQHATVWLTDGGAPTVSFVSPAPDSSDAPPDGPVIVLFSEAMNADSLAASRLVVSAADGSAVAGSLAYDPAAYLWRFDPVSPLAPGATYSVTVDGSVEDEFRTALGSDVEWQFVAGDSPDGSAPAVSATWPADPCRCSPPDTRILLEADEVLDPASQLVLTDSTAAPVAGRVVYHGRILEFVPAGRLEPDETYTVTADRLRDLSGNPAPEPAAWQFGTDDGLAQGYWEELAALPGSVAGTVMASDGTHVFAFAGDAGDSRFRGYYYRPTEDAWQPVAELPSAATTAPEPRLSPSVIWSGSEFLVYGGYTAASRPRDDGGAYRPVNDAWRALSGSWWDGSRMSYPQLLGLGGHSAVWTGTEMILWGGEYDGVCNRQPINRGWTYDPAADRWAITGPEPTVDGSYCLLPDPDAPAPRSGHAAVWTGTEMIVWGGIDAADRPLAGGGRYDPAAGSWQPLPVDNAPPVTSRTAVHWTGIEMLAWDGGQDAPRPLFGEAMRQVRLRAYDPGTNAWQSPASGWEPAFLPGTPVFMLGEGPVATVIGMQAGDNGAASNRTLAAYVYEASTGRWHTGAARPVEACAIAAAALHQGSAYVSCGGRTYRFTP